MGQDSAIEWTHHTFNPWIGCTKVSAGCAHCYAEALMDKRWGKVKWGPSGTRVRTSDANWREPYKWDKAAAKAGERHRVFCASLADVFEDRPELVPWRRELLDMICRTPNLDWLLLTKRPENALRMMVEGGLYAVENPNLPCPQPNLWIGTSVEDQDAADERVLQLMKVPAAIRFLSMEPLLGSVDLTNIGPEKWDVTRGWKANADNERGWANTSRIDWIIVGGESGQGARPCYTNWIDGIADQCRAAMLPLFVKQLGANHRCVDDEFGDVPIKLKDSKGGDIDEFPADLRVRQFPIPVGAAR
jgi:protein gp37